MKSRYENGLKSKEVDLETVAGLHESMGCSLDSDPILVDDHVALSAKSRPECSSRHRCQRELAARKV